MQRRIWISFASFAVITRLVVGCGEPPLDDLHRPPREPEAGGAVAVPSGVRAKGGSAGMKSTGGRAATAAAPRDGTAAMPAADAGEWGGGQGGDASIEPVPAPPTSSGGRPAAASGGRAATGGKADTGGVAESTGGAAATGGAAEVTGGSDGSGGAPASGGMTALPETGGTATGGQGTGGSEPSPPSRALWFSEYVEGPEGTRKALEISTLEATTLRGCRVDTYSNGSSKASSKLALDADITPEAPWVLCSKELVELGATCSDQVGLNFNGDDAVALVCDDERIIDVIGHVGEPPPDKYWGTPELKTADMTLRRVCSVTHGDPLADDVFEPSLEWEAAGPDALDGLGSHCLE